MTDRVTVEQLKSMPIEQVLQEIADQDAAVTVLLADGREIVIQPRPILKPLPKLEGRVPEGWKDAVNARE